ncbi:MAG: hypothetical protein MUD01_14005 [Chloroflexaceae bacterium]|nr:hypothetical protein [Chloroflexaceae bacterium]
MFVLLLALLSLAACSSWTEYKFRFAGSYTAPKSGYRLELIRQGIQDRSAETTVASHSLVQVCPLAGRAGRPLRFTMTYETQRDPSLVSFMAEDQPGIAHEWDWRSSEGLLQQSLARNGYTGLDAAELTAMVWVLDSGQGVFAGQVDHVTVQQADYQYNADFDQTLPVQEWIAPTELPACPPIS